MFKKFKVFVFSDISLNYREIRLFKTKTVFSGFLIGIIASGILLAANHFAGDPLGLAFSQVSKVKDENRVLKEQIAEISAKMKRTQEGLDDLMNRDNELRLMVDLSLIDSDTREASVGGALPASQFAFLNNETEEILDNTHRLIDKLEREVKLQQQSYEEIYKRYEYNKDFFSHLPAIKPASGYYSINGFGMRIHPVLRVYRMHEGIDIINDVGTKVYAAGDGVVRYAGRTQGGYGVVVEISHGYGYSTLYAHLSKVLVRPGQAVKRGELIARSGRSGLVSGPHLHYEVRYNGRRQNPVDYFFDDVDAARYKTLLASTQ